MRHINGFLNSQPLWTKEQFGLQQFEMPDLDLTTFHPKPIPTNLRLGHQVEYIFKQLIEHSEAYEVLAHNIQIKRGKETVGEIDFILEDIRFRENVKRNTTSESRQIHLELTYKFYIIDPSISEPIHRLMGPNRKDMFFTKMEKTRDRQMPLLFSPQGKKTLVSLNIQADNLIQETYFLGQLFVPYKQKVPSIRPLNSDCIVGFWLSFDEFNSEDFKRYTYYIPHKYEWLQKPHEAVNWQNHFNILMEINIRHINERAPMVWIQKDDKTFEKCFVVWW